MYMDAQKLQNKLRLLAQQLEAANPFVIAFSGGLDSRFLAHLAQKSSLRFELFHVSGPHVPKDETEYALRWASERRIPLTEIQFSPLALYDVRQGTKERCYACKRAIFERIASFASGKSILDGSNASDLSKFRPGLRALKELGIISPLAVCGVSKPEIMALAMQTGLDNPTQAARPCLLTRLEYGLPPTEEVLSRLEMAEKTVQALGFKNFRLRLHQENPPLLQVSWEEAELLETKKAKLVALLAEHGFENADMLAEISLSGYFDSL